MGELDERKDWDDVNFVNRIRAIGKECGWARNLWCSHARGYAPNRNYNIKPDWWGKPGSIHSRITQDIIKKPYPEVNKLTCEPLIK